MWACAYAQWERAATDVRQRGPVVAGARGRELVKNPSVAMMRDFATLLNRFAAELGATPAARAGMMITPRRAQSLEDLLHGRKR